MQALRRMLSPLFRTVTRRTLDRALVPLLLGTRGGVWLDVGSKHSPYRRYIRADRYMTLDIDATWQPDIVSDLHDIKWESDHFDVVLATEVLEHLQDPQRAVDEVHRILKPGGVVIATTRFIYPYHGDPHDYYRFTWDSLAAIFARYDSVEVRHHGNAFQSAWQILTGTRLGLPLNLLNPLIALLPSRRTKSPSGFIVRAIK